MGNTNGGMLDKSADMTMLTPKSSASEQNRDLVFEELRRFREDEDQKMRARCEKQSRRDKNRGWDELVENLGLLWDERVGQPFENVCETTPCKVCLFKGESNQTSMDVQA
jgi:hypothetical protein